MRKGVKDNTDSRQIYRKGCEKVENNTEEKN